jgi:hypothetical protein
MSLLRFATLRHRACLLPFIAAFCMAAPSLGFAADSIEHAVTGKWRFTAALDAADISSLDEREAQQLVGHVFLISKGKVKFDQRDCGPTDFEVEKVEPKLHLRQEFHASAEKLGLPNPVTIVDLNCTSVFIKNSNKLVIAWQGWFFDAVRVKR